MVSDEADESRDDPGKADHYRHEDGTDEIVFAVEDGHVLAIREYRSVEDFEQAVADAERIGTHEGVADLPGVEAFEGGGTGEGSEAGEGGEAGERSRADAESGAAEEGGAVEEDRTDE